MGIELFYKIRLTDNDGRTVDVLEKSHRTSKEAENYFASNVQMLVKTKPPFTKAYIDLHIHEIRQVSGLTVPNPGKLFNN